MDILSQPVLRNLLILAILIRLLVMPFYYHPDIKTYHFQASFLQDGVIDIYSFLEANKERLPLKEEFVYFPLTYFFLGGYQILISPLLGGDFKDWLFDASAQAISDFKIYRYLFILKFPYLLIDVAMAFLLTGFFIDWQQKKRVFIFWLFNPFTFIAIYLYSNVDIIPVFLSTVALIFAVKNKLFISSLFIGIAAAFKAFPFLFFPFLLLYGKRYSQVITMLSLAIGSFGAILIPFWSESFRQAALVSGLTTRIVSFGIGFGFGEMLILPIFFISILFFLSLVDREKVTENMEKILFSLLLIIFSFIHFHIQWLLWMMPLAALIIVSSRQLNLLLYVLIVLAMAIPFLYNDKAMTFGLLEPYSHLYTLLPLPFAAIQRFYDPYVVQSVLHSIFAGGSLVLIYKMFRVR